MDVRSSSSSTAEKRHEDAFQAMSPDARTVTQQGSTYSGANRTQDGNIIQINSINAHSVQIETAKRSVDVLEWLYAPPYDSKHKKTKRERVKGSGAWLFERDEYQRWYHGAALDRLLWCHGQPGAGKTFITSAVIDELLANQNERNIATAYIYLDYADREAQTIEDVFASILKQISLCKEEAVNEINRAYEKGARRVDTDSLAEALACMPQYFDKIFIAIDALDECSDKLRKMLLKQLHSLDGPKWKFFLTGRSHLSDVPKKFPSCIQVTVIAHREDVEKLVRDRIHDEAGLAELFEDNPLLQDHAVSNIVEKSSGMFLLVTLMLNNIASSTCENDVEESLEQLPIDLNQSYDRTLERIKGQDSKKIELSCRILWWLSRSRRPLSCTELPQAVAVRDGDRGRDTKKESKPGIMTTVCMGLVFVDDAKNFRLVHFSAQEYLRAHFSLSTITKILREDELIARACLTILLYDEFEEGPCNSYSSWKARLERYPMLQYAAQHWYDHLGESMSEELTSLALKFLRSPHKVAAATQIRTNSLPPILGMLFLHRDLFDSTHTTGFHIASQSGVVYLVQQLFREPGIDINAIDAYDTTPLTRAIQDGRSKVVDFLLSIGTIDYELKNQGGETPFLLAARCGKTDIVAQLLAKGVAVQARNKKMMNALHLAAPRSDDSVEMIELLIASGVDMHAKDIDGRTPLHLAILWSAHKMIKILLSRGADTSVADDRGDMPLHLATIKGSLDMAQALYKAGANIQARSGDGRSVLTLAAASGQREMVEWLLYLGAEANTVDKRGYTPLHYAARSRLTIVQSLHQAGADVHARPDHGSSVLGLAIEQDRARIVEWLLSVGTRSPRRDEHILHVAAAVGALRTVKLLLSKGVDGDANYKFSGKALQAVCYGRHANIVQLLLDDRAAIDRKSGLSGLSLFAAAFRGHLKILHLLTERNTVCVNLVDGLGRNALHFAARGGHVKCFAFLLSKGLDLSSVDIKGNTVLSYAAAAGSISMVKSLLCRGIDTFPRVSGVWSPLHWAYRASSSEVVDLLKTVYSEEDVIETVEPPGLWTPLSIGLYHRNKILDDSSQEHSSPYGSPLEKSNTEKTAIANRAGDWHGRCYCNECFFDIYGPRFHCLSCVDYDLCFMCNLTVTNSHPPHQWEVFAWKLGKSVEVESAEL